MENWVTGSSNVFPVQSSHVRVLTSFAPQKVQIISW
jgi:hypothetical protein